MLRPLFTLAVVLMAIGHAVAADFATEMMEATFRVGDGSAATCFLVRRAAPDGALYLVTVAHALDDNAADAITLVLREAKPDGTYTRRDYSLALRRDGRPRWVRHPKQDVAVLKITEPLPVPIAGLPISALANPEQLQAAGVHLCSPLFVLGYPMGLEADVSGLPVARSGIFASPPLLPATTHPTFLADYTASGGDSGGPVFMEGSEQHPLLAGLIVEQHYFVDEVKAADGAHRMRTPLGVVNVLHAPYIRETIEMAARQEAPPSK